MASGDDTGRSGGEPASAADWQRLWAARERSVDALLERDDHMLHLLAETMLLYRQVLPTPLVDALLRFEDDEGIDTPLDATLRDMASAMLPFETRMPSILVDELRSFAGNAEPTHLVALDDADGYAVDTFLFWIAAALRRHEDRLPPALYASLEDYAFFEEERSGEWS